MLSHILLKIFFFFFVITFQVFTEGNGQAFRTVQQVRYTIFVSPELSSVRDYVITHSVLSMYVCVCMYVVFCKIDHCIHIH